jgi:hypothetical protein
MWPGRRSFRVNYVPDRDGWNFCDLALIISSWQAELQTHARGSTDYQC